MTMDVDPPGKGRSQGIWCDPPDVDDEPDDWCETASEGLVLTDLPTLKRFFRDKCRWNPEAVALITRLVWVEGQTWQEPPWWLRRGATTRGREPKGGGDDGRPRV
jgi:hypothetical protein